MRDVRGAFWVKRAEFATLHAAPHLCYLIGGYDGSRNYGDVLQVAANIRRLARMSEAPLAVPLVDVRHAGSHHDLARDQPAFFGDACVLYYAVETDPLDDPRDDLQALDLVAVEHAPTRASQLLVYGGGFFAAGQPWGRRKLDLIDAVERWMEGGVRRRAVGGRSSSSVSR